MGHKISSFRIIRYFNITMLLTFKDKKYKTEDFSQEL